MGVDLLDIAVEQVQKASGATNVVRHDKAKGEDFQPQAEFYFSKEGDAEKFAGKVQRATGEDHPVLSWPTVQGTSYSVNVPTPDLFDTDTRGKLLRELNAPEPRQNSRPHASRNCSALLPADQALANADPGRNPCAKPDNGDWKIGGKPDRRGGISFPVPH